MISDLPKAMAEKVLSKLPITSLPRVRFTCKKWNSLSKTRSFTRRFIGEAKAAAKQKQRNEFQVVMMLDYKVHLMSVNLLNPSVERIGTLASGVEISNIFHCQGLLLCVTEDQTRVVVWNPFNGQKRWIQPRHSLYKCDRYALGYEKTINNSRRSHKVLRYLDDYYRTQKEFEVFSLNSNSWKVVDVNPDWHIPYFHRGLSLKGNTYWIAGKKLPNGGSLGSLFLLCFDFTTESFEPRLPLPFSCRYEDIVTLSSVREKQIVVMFQEADAPAHTLKIWISSKIDPNGVSWNKLFLAVDMKPLMGPQFQYFAGGFFVDEKKKVVVIIDKAWGRYYVPPTGNGAYIIGENGYFKTVDLGHLGSGDCWPRVCSYVPSSVKIKQASPLGNKRKTPP